MNRRKFLSRILCLGAVAAIVPKIIPKNIPTNQIVINTTGKVGITTSNPSAKLDVRKYPLTEKEVFKIGYRPPEWATRYRFLYSVKGNEFGQLEKVL